MFCRKYLVIDNKNDHVKKIRTNIATKSLEKYNTDRYFGPVYGFDYNYFTITAGDSVKNRYGKKLKDDLDSK